jgi:ATP-binding cassette, subfamily F, member 3
VREERREAEAAAVAAAKQERRARAKPARDAPRPANGRSKNAQRRIAELELEVERAEAALAALEDELADPAMWSSPSRTERSTSRHTAARQAVAEAYARWEQASAEPSV